MNHKQLVEEWKEKLEQYNMDVGNADIWSRLVLLFEDAMLAAAKGAAESSKLDEFIIPVSPLDPTFQYEVPRKIGYDEATQKNAAQLKNYFDDL